ncbi:MAG: hypothetical protein QNJ46_33465 [Leptolyngbyaceae cyanobacterium MO_188.B28]|nr:hypothetical protein [Leptolyngbyaceae cyanobacterium MO_188.B28]
MANPVLTLTEFEQQRSHASHDEIQLALAIADEPVLRSLLEDATPIIVPPHRIGSVTAEIGVPGLDVDRAIDGILRFEAIHCVLANTQPNDEGSAKIGSQHRLQDYSYLTRHRSELYTLAQDIPLSQAIALLSQTGFSPEQVKAILYLPNDAWHKSWWYTLDAAGYLTAPFQRFIRTRQYADGAVTIQYKDYYAEERPLCFKSKDHRTPVIIKSEGQGFRETLEKINQAREQLNTPQALLISTTLSGLEAQGFIRQGVSLYTAQTLRLPTSANCARCANLGCPMNSRADSPVMTCAQFSLVS